MSTRAIPPNRSAQESAGTPPSRLALWSARAAWLCILALVVSMFVVNAPTNLVYTLQEYPVGLARRAILSFTTPVAFAERLVAVRWLIVTVYFAVALVIAWRKWTDWFALLVSAALLMLAWGFVMRGDQSTWQYPRLLIELVPAVPSILGGLPVIALILLFFLFPDGRFVNRGYQWLAVPPVLLTVLFFLGEAYRTSWPASGEIVERLAWPVWAGVLLASLLAALGGQVYRYRLATAAQRQQIKWVLFGLAGMLAIPLFSWPLEDAGGAWGALAAIGLEHVAGLFLPITIGFSMLRYRLWDVDLLINRTLVYGLLTAVVLTLYGLSVGLAGLLVPAQGNWLVLALALAVLVPTVAPARRRLQALADRWLPVPPRPQVPDEAERDETGSLAPLLRLARAAWALLFAFLLWQFVAQFMAVDDVLFAIRTEWIVQMSLQALPGLPAAAFARYLLLMRVVVLAVFWGPAALIYRQRRDDGLALFVAFLLLLSPITFALTGDDHWLEQWLGLPAIGLLLLLPFLFPDGRFVPQSARWRALLLSALLAAPFLIYFLASLARPEARPDGWAYASFLAAITLALAAGLASQVYRYRFMATAVQRQQTKWVLLGLGLTLAWLLLAVLWIAGVLGRLGVSEPFAALAMVHLSVLAQAALPVTIVFSILRYRLWEVDLLINRTLVFGGLTLLVAAAYVLVVGLLGILFQAGGSLPFSVLATGLVAILFSPLRQRLQQAVNRLMYGERDDPVTVLSRLGERLEQTAVAADVLPAIVETVAQALKLPYVALTTHQEEGDRAAEEVVAAYGRPAASSQALPLTYQGQAIGRLLVVPRAPGEAFTPAEERLLANVARQAGAAVYAARLTAHLQRSRERLVTALEEERRRIRRDLHDGLGPQLATLSLKLDAAHNYLPHDPAAADSLLVELKSQVQEAIQDIRRLVYDLWPPALDQLGLVSALREQAAAQSQNGLQVSVVAPSGLPSLPAAVEVAAFRIALEAMTNTARHAGAQHCAVSLTVNDGLRLEIRDDGRGLPDAPRPGVGLASMRERAVELGGYLEVESERGGGTLVRAVLPLNAARRQEL